MNEAEGDEMNGRRLQWERAKWENIPGPKFYEIDAEREAEAREQEKMTAALKEQQEAAKRPNSQMVLKPTRKPGHSMEVQKIIAEQPTFAKGVCVQHPKFGIGTYLDSTSKGVSVRFQTGFTLRLNKKEARGLRLYP